MAKKKPRSRYRRVVEILDAAAGESRADYGGVGAFWHLDYEDFLRVEVEGVRMIAPPQEEKAAGSCCCSPNGACSRSDASGLILGLRGEDPFDGSRFPPLPWGGEQVAPAEVGFIADWIDDGCPEDDRELADLPVEIDSATSSTATVGAENAEDVVIESTDEGFDVFAGSPNEYASGRGEIQVRMNLDCLLPRQVERLREAFRHLYHLNKWPADRRSYNNIALIHQNHCQHGWERFLPWHRVYMYEFEQALQDQCPDVTLPYWDWTMPQYRPSCPEKGAIIPESLKAFLTDKSLVYLGTAEPKLPKSALRKLEKDIVEPGLKFASQQRFFKAVAESIGEEYTEGAHRRRFIDALLDANALWYPLRYPGEYQNSSGQPSTIERVIHYHYPTADDIAQISSLRTFRDFGGGSLYNDSFGFLDQNPHNTMHIWTGGMNPDYDPSKVRDGDDAPDDLGPERNRTVRVSGRRFHSREDMYGQPQFGDMFSNLTASYDPIFWPIHSNVDRLWWEWQQQNPHAVPADLDSVLTPWSYTIADTLDAARFGYDYVKCSFLIPVGLESPVGKFVSKPIPVAEAVRSSFRRAEVRLHRVPQLIRSGFVRVFLGLPGADATTPIDDPHYAGYLAIFGHGACYGGPGHCDLPGERRPYDRRPRSHNTPRNHRIDVTQCARRLLEDGAETLSITLVVIGVDYCEDPELLRLEGVSLSFLD